MIDFDKNFVIPKLDSKNKETFVNPLGTEGHPDPCIVWCENDKCYYGISTTGQPSLWGDDRIIMHRAEKFCDLFTCSESKVIYQSNAKDETFGYLWAPELHFIDGKWYIYTSCQMSDENTVKHVIVLEAKTDSPFDGFKFLGHINRNVFAIDPSVYVDEETGEMYICCSEVVPDVGQVLTIQQMKSPSEPCGERAIIAKAELAFELVPPYIGSRSIVEGGYFIKSPDGRLFIAYSANGCWSDDYAMGLLEYKGGDMVSADSWEKSPWPIVKKSGGNYGPGHATFFYSPDKTELWICCHCMEKSNPGVEPIKRLCHTQRVFFDKTGFPHIGDLVPQKIPYPVPSNLKKGETV